MTVTVFNRTNGAFEFPYNTTKGKTAMSHGDIDYCTLAPNFTTAIPEEIFEQVKSHPLFAFNSARGYFHVVKREDLKITGATENGMLKVDDPVFGEGLTVSDFKDLQKKDKRYVPSIDFLMNFRGVGKATAEKILNTMPNGGWQDFTTMKSAIRDLPGCKEIDWTETKL